MVDTSMFQRNIPLTHGEKFDKAMKIDRQDDANEFLEAYIQWTMQMEGLSRADADVQCRFNITYYAGYMEASTYQRILRLFRGEALQKALRGEASE